MFAALLYAVSSPLDTFLCRSAELKSAPSGNCIVVVINKSTGADVVDGVVGGAVVATTTLLDTLTTDDVVLGAMTLLELCIVTDDEDGWTLDEDDVIFVDDVTFKDGVAVDLETIGVLLG